MSKLENEVNKMLSIKRAYGVHVNLDPLPDFATMSQTEAEEYADFAFVISGETYTCSFEQLREFLISCQETSQ